MRAPNLSYYPSWRRTFALIVMAGLIAACGRAQVWSPTRVILEGPPDRIATLISEHHLAEGAVRLRGERLADDRARYVFDKPNGLSPDALVKLGKSAAEARVSYSFSIGPRDGSTLRGRSQGASGV